MLKAWSSIEKLPYCLSRSFSNFKVTRDKKIIDFDPNWVFRDCNSSLISLMARKWWFWNDVQSLMWYRRGALLILNVFSLICARINCWVNNGEAGDLRRHRVNYDVIVMHHNLNSGRWLQSSQCDYLSISMFFYRGIICILCVFINAQHTYWHKISSWRFKR